MKTFWCKFVDPMLAACTPGSFKVDADSYRGAARVHVGLTGPRSCLLLRYVDVEVKLASDNAAAKIIRVWIDLRAREVKRARPY